MATKFKMSIIRGSFKFYLQSILSLSDKSVKSVLKRKHLAKNKHNGILGTLIVMHKRLKYASDRHFRKNYA